MIRVLLVDNHTLCRQGLTSLLRQSAQVDVVGDADYGQALELAATVNPDVCLVDGQDGYQLGAELTKSGCRVLVLSASCDEQFARHALMAGAAGFITKAASFEEFLKALRVVHSGERYVPQELRPKLADTLADSGEPATPGALLSRREFQVMRFLAGGLTNRQIAGELGISIKTIDTHRGHVLKKLQLRNNSDITRFAIRNGYTEI